MRINTYMLYSSIFFFVCVIVPFASTTQTFETSTSIYDYDDEVTVMMRQWPNDFP